MRKAVVLVVEKNTLASRDHFSRWLSAAGHTVVRKTVSEDLSAAASQADCDLLLISDVCLRGQYDGAAIAAAFLTRKIPVIAFGTPANLTAVRQVMQLGVSDYLFEPLERELLIAAVDRALAEKRSDLTPPAAQADARSLVTRSDKMHRLLEMAARVACSEATVLISGESGTGKELLARYIHQHSRRSKAAFIDMNCAALPDNLAESELFGYEKGAFTGAQQRRQGKFEVAHKGTLLLDEIGDLALPLQAKLLRVLQERQFTRLGGNEAVQVDVRLIAVTNCDLAQMVTEGLFREDLYYRLRVIPLTVPPLREHPEDIVFLANHFLKHFSEGGPTRKFADCALQALQEWPWPGNIRELQNTVQRAVLLSADPLIRKADLLLEELRPGAAEGSPVDMVGRTVKEMEKTLIEQTLAHVSFNRTQAARMLGISIRTLRNKLTEFNQEAASTAGI